MTYTHHFENVQLPPRTDGIAWTRVLVEISPPDDGQAWTQIDDQAVTIDLTPAIPDPIALDVTTAPLETALFRFRGNVSPSNPSPPSPPVLSPPPAWRPTMEQVAAILHARTRGLESQASTESSELGVWTATTRPSSGQVLALIDVAVGDLAGMLGGRTPCTASLAAAAASASAYRAAQLVEVGFYPEQTEDDETAFDALGKLWKPLSESVIAAIRAACPAVSSPDPTSGSIVGMPLGRVPVADRTGWGTRW